MTKRYGLQDDQWAKIESLLPGREEMRGVTEKINRLFVEALLYHYHAGIPWRDLPERFDGWKNVHRRFTQWAASRAWERVFKALSADIDNEYAMIDSTIVRARQHSAGARKKRARRLSDAAKADDDQDSCLCDALGNPIDLRKAIWIFCTIPDEY